MFMSETHSAHAKPLRRMQSLFESRGGSKVTKPIFSNSANYKSSHVASNCMVICIMVIRRVCMKS